MRSPILALATAGVAIFAIAGCSSTTSTSPAPASPTVEAPSIQPSESLSMMAEGYTQEIEAGFMSTCPGSAMQANSSLSESAATDYCGCVYRAFEAKLPFDQFLAMNSGTTSQAAKDLVAECVDDPTAY